MYVCAAYNEASADEFRLGNGVKHNISTALPTHCSHTPAHNLPPDAWAQTHDDSSISMSADEKILCETIALHCALQEQGCGQPDESTYCAAEGNSEELIVGPRSKTLEKSRCRGKLLLEYVAVIPDFRHSPKLPVIRCAALFLLSPIRSNI